MTSPLGVCPRNMPAASGRCANPTAAGQTGRIDVDVNYMYRVPLWPILPVGSRRLGGWQATDIPVLDIHELAAGKLAALLSRRRARDLFDCRQLLPLDTLDWTRLRTAFVVYGAMNRRDWRTITTDDVAFDPRELSGQLLPVATGQRGGRHGRCRIRADAG